LTLDPYRLAMFFSLLGLRLMQKPPSSLWFPFFPKTVLLSSHCRLPFITKTGQISQISEQNLQFSSQTHITIGCPFCKYSNNFSHDHCESSSGSMLRCFSIPLQVSSTSHKTITLEQKRARSRSIFGDKAFLRR